MYTQGHSFDAQTEAVIAKVRKLLALSQNNDNEHQAEAAANKARELLEAYNLDMAVIGKKTDSFAPRDKQTLRGGLYKWQRDLWNMTAMLNFCRYSYYRGLQAGSSYEHQLIGSKVNVISSTIMAQYLQDTIERMAQDWVKEHRPGRSVFIKEAIAYREGMATRITNRMWRIREERLREDREKSEKRKAAGNGYATENALVLADVISTEEDLNTDFILGRAPGTSAKLRMEREARQEAADREANELLRKQEEWDAAHPEEAAARKAKERKEYDERMKKWSRNSRPRKPTAEEERRSLGSFRSGYNDGEHVSLDKQVGGNKTRRLE